VVGSPPNKISSSAVRRTRYRICDANFQKLDGILDANDPNLNPFLVAGGKLILYQGWSDPVVSPLNVIRYYSNVAAAVSGEKGGVHLQTSIESLPKRHPGTLVQQLCWVD
jgi:hypothetical protein